MGFLIFGIVLLAGVMTGGLIGSHQPDKVNAEKCQALQDGQDISTAKCDVK